MKSVLNAKFTIVFLQVVVVAFIFFTKYQNIAASSSVGTSKSSMATYIDGFAGVSISMLAVQMLFSMMGVPFDGRFLPLQIILQVVALFGYGCYILMRMEYQSIAYIWGAFCLIPFLLEITGLISQCLRNRKYQMLDHK